MEIPAFHQPTGRPALQGWPWTEQTDRSIYSAHREWPRISIITPSYDQAAYLEQTIRSVLLQNYPNLEYIIIDGGSHDNSVEIIKKYAPWIDHWVSEPDAGQSDALEKGFDRAHGEIAAWINSDDFYEKDAFFKVATAYMEAPFDFYCGACYMIGTEGQQLRRLYTETITAVTLRKYWKPHFCPPQPSIFFKRDIFRALGPFDKTLRYSMDFDLWLKASRKHCFTHTTDTLSFYRVHADSKTGSPGGLQKFVPEWKMLIGRSLQQEPLPVKWKYRLQEYIVKIKIIADRWIKRIAIR